MKETEMRTAECPGKHSGVSPSAVSGKPNGHVKQFNVVSDLNSYREYGSHCKIGNHSNFVQPSTLRLRLRKPRGTHTPQQLHRLV